MRVQAGDCALATNKLALAAIYYDKANTTAVPQTTGDPNASLSCNNVR